MTSLRPFDRLRAIRRACSGWSVCGQVAINESATRTQLEVFLEFPGSGFILESTVPRNDPWCTEAGIPAISPSMLGEATFQILREAGVESRRVFLAAEDVNVKHWLLAFAKASAQLRHSSRSERRRSSSGRTWACFPLCSWAREQGLLGESSELFACSHPPPPTLLLAILLAVSEPA
jgi:hypothetical protein